MLEFTLGIGIPVVLLLLGLFAGGWAERSHLESLRRREAQTRGMVVTQVKSFPGAVPGDKPPTFMVAEVVIASDYLKTFLAGFRNIFGGRVRSYQTLVDRARREASLRIVEGARRMGYNAVCNVRLETADVGGSNTGRKVPMAAILASGTAYHAATE